MTWVDHAMDATLCTALPLLAWGATAAGDRSRQAILFIAFSLLAALAWARLEAPDVALVEASVGAGLTGALLMTSLSWLPGADHPRRTASEARARVPLWVASAGVVALLAMVFANVPAGTVGLREQVLRAAPQTGVSHPVTAVLLSLRGYDTLLEIAVLVAVATATLVQSPEQPPAPARDEPPLPALVRLLTPGVVLVAGYLLWRGSHAPGGAFQAGSILGGGVILLLLARTVGAPGTGIVVRLVFVGGLAIFLAVAAAPLLLGGALLELPPSRAGSLILLIESALTVSIGAVLVLFFQATRPRDGEP